MPKLFSETPTLPVRALQIWQILIGRAHNRQTMTYGEVAKLLNYGGAGVLGNNLDFVLCYCAVNQLPPLSCLVVNQDTGLPGEGLGIPASQLHSARELVYQYNWYGLIPPTPDEFAAAHKTIRG